MAAKREHHYSATVTWTGNLGHGTSAYNSYSRDHLVTIGNKPELECSSDAPFMGDITRHNPEDLFLVSLSACHMLWYLHLCADKGIVVTSYVDSPTGTMVDSPTEGHFTGVTLHPHVTITDSNRVEEANELHAAANKRCFIANSCNFPVEHEPTCTTG